MQLPSRFWEKVDKSGDCWLWTGAITDKGYGTFHLDGRSRLVHKLVFGEVPTGVKLDHKCHTRHCVNREHLRVTTNKQNGENRKGLTKNNTSGYRGINWDTTNKKWLAKVKHHGKTIHVGRFSCVEEANKAVIAKRLELFTHNDMDR